MFEKTNYLPLNANVAVFLFSCLTVLSSWLVTSGNSTLYMPAVAQTKQILGYLLVLSLMFQFASKSIQLEKKYLLFCIFPFVYYLFSYYNHYDQDHLVSAVVIFILILYLLISPTLKINVYVILKNVFVVMSAFGIVGYVSYMFGIPFPHTQVEYYGNENWTYINYFFTILCNTEGQIRLCGFFNEPGLLGTVLGLILAAEGLNLRKRANIIFLAAGTLSFSLAFFLTLAIYFLLKDSNKMSRWFIVLSFVIIYLYVIPNIHTGILAVDNILGRLAFEDGRMVGDNRSHGLDYLLATTLASGNAMWGNGMGYVASFDLNTSSYQTIIIDNGIIGFTVLYVLFTLCCLVRYRNSKQALLYIIVFFINVYQRPNIYSLLYFTLLFGGLEYIYYIKENE